VAPAGKHPRRHRDAQHLALAGRIQTRRLERPDVAGPDLARERRRRERLCLPEPARLVFRRGHASEEPRLAPAELAGGERRIDRREPSQRGIDVGEILELARRDARPLAGVIRGPREAERGPGARCEQAARDACQRPPQRRTASHLRQQSRLERRQGIGARVVAGLRACCARHLGLHRDRGSERRQSRRRV
jgi:hypothetical protein